MFEGTRPALVDVNISLTSFGQRNTQIGMVGVKLDALVKVVEEQRQVRDGWSGEYLGQRPEFGREIRFAEGKIEILV